MKYQSEYQKLWSPIKKSIENEFNKVFFTSNFLPKLKQHQKVDNSPVTILDTKISKIFEKQLFAKRSPRNKQVSFICEEKFTDAPFPLLKDLFPSFIIDPIDGTRELIKGVPECAVSWGFFSSSKINDPSNWGLIFNPFTGFELSSSSTFVANQSHYPNHLLGMVSRTEWQEGLFRKYQKQLLKQKTIAGNCISLVPKGSIAYKLALLAAGIVDFVFSYRSKNIWDIAAGTLLCDQRNFVFFEKGKKITHLKKQTYTPPLLWCRGENYHELSQYFID